MKASSVVELVLTNAILIGLIAFVRGDQAARLDYWSRLGFSSTGVYSAFILRYPAVSTRASIPGLPTLDWVQVFLTVAIVADAFFVVAYYRGRASRGDLATA